MKRLLIGTFVAVMFLGCVKKDVYLKDTGALKDRIASLEADNGKLNGEKDKLIGEKDKLKGDNDILGAQLSAMGGKNVSLNDNLKQTIAKMNELKAQAENRKVKIAELKAKLQSMVSAGQLKIRTDKGRMIVEMAEKVLFDSGKFKLKPEGLLALEQLTEILKTLEGRTFQVAGHTDDVGADDMNWTLSLNRAKSVAQYMIEKGMPAERLSAAGYGKFQPVAPNDTPEGKAQNRRIEIALVPNIEEILGFGAE